MEIGSISNSYADIMQDIATSQTTEIQRAAIIGQLSTKVAIASDAANDIIASMSGYQMDSVIPEDSTVSFHI